MDEQVIETWRIHNRINLYLLNAIPPEHVGQLSPLKGRTPFKLFAHMHNVRLMWLKEAAPELMAGLEKLDGDNGTREQLVGALTSSGQAVESLLRKSFAEGGRVRGFKPHAVAFMAYLISHDAHHRGQLTMILKALGHPLDNKTDYGMWEWGVR